MNGFYDAKGYFWLALEKFDQNAGLQYSKAQVKTTVRKDIKRSRYR